MIYSIDESVGRMMRELDDLQLSEKTIVIFTSDNGGVGGYEREGLKKAGGVTDTMPLRSGKGSLYEGGTRTPLIVRWPVHCGWNDLQRPDDPCRFLSDVTSRVGESGCAATSGPRW